MFRAEISEGHQNSSVASKFHIGLQLQVFNLSNVALSGRTAVKAPANFDVLETVVGTLPASILALNLSDNLLGDDGLKCIRNALKSVQHSNLFNVEDPKSYGHATDVLTGLPTR